MITRRHGPTLVGERVTLRPYGAGFDEGEIERLYAWARDAELLELAGGIRIDLPYSRFRKLFLEKLASADPAIEQLFAVLEPDGRMIGRIGLFGLASNSRGAELGVVIGDRDSWGRGYGREAVGLLADHAFAALGLRRITLYTFPKNRRAQHAFAAAGFRLTRRLRRFDLACGTHDEVEMQLGPADRSRVHATQELALPAPLPPGLTSGSDDQRRQALPRIGM